jgi:hypothetical protein
MKQQEKPGPLLSTAAAPDAVALLLLPKLPCCCISAPASHKVSQERHTSGIKDLLSASCCETELEETFWSERQLRARSVFAETELATETSDVAVPFVLLYAASSAYFRPVKVGVQAKPRQLQKTATTKQQPGATTPSQEMQQKHAGPRRAAASIPAKVKQGALSWPGAYPVAMQTIMRNPYSQHPTLHLPRTHTLSSLVLQLKTQTHTPMF